MLETPVVYWDVRSHADYWREPFAHSDDLKPGPIPPGPGPLLARGIPEPMWVGLLALAGFACVRRRQ